MVPVGTNRLLLTKLRAPYIQERVSSSTTPFHCQLSRTPTTRPANPRTFFLPVSPVLASLLLVCPGGVFVLVVSRDGQYSVPTGSRGSSSLFPELVLLPSDLVEDTTLDMSPNRKYTTGGAWRTSPPP